MGSLRSRSRARGLRAHRIRTVGVAGLLCALTVAFIVQPVGATTTGGGVAVRAVHHTSGNPGCDDPPGTCVIQANGCPQGGPMQAPAGQHCVPIPSELVINQQPGSGGSCLTNYFAQVTVLPTLDDYEAVWYSDIGLGSRWWEAPGTVGPNYVTGEGYQYQVPKGDAAWSAAGGANASGGCPAAPEAGTFGVAGWGETDRWSVSGYITYAATGEAAKGIRVTADCPSGYSVSTNDKGYYQFLLSQGECKIVPTPPDGLTVDPVSKTVNVQSNIDNVNFQLDAVLYFSVKKGLSVTTSSGLVKAGTNFTEQVTLKDISKTKTVVVAPIYPTLRGNANGGALQPVGGTVQKSITSLATANPSPIVKLAPGEEQVFDSVIYTDASKTLGTNDAGQKVSGGTRATVTFSRPDAYVLESGDKLTPLNPVAITVAQGSTDPINVGIDDSAPDQMPFNGYLAAEDISKGTWLGLYHFTVGLIQGVAVGINALGSAIADIPTAIKGYVDAEAELWSEVKDDPVQEAAFFNIVTNSMLLVYKQAPFLLKKVGDIKSAVDTAVFNHFNKIEQDWRQGDWEAAVTAWADDGANLSADLLILNPSLMADAIGDATIARVPGVIEDAESVEAASFAKDDAVVDETLGTGETEGEIGESVAAEAKLTPGNILTAEQMAQIFGVSKAEFDAMVALAKEEGVIITLRSRASEAIPLIEKGLSYMKPAAIKLKTVSAIDVKYLGYPADVVLQGDKVSTIGQVLVKSPLYLSADCAEACALAQLQAKLVADGVAVDSPEFLEIQTRWTQRYDEWTSTKPGYVNDLQTQAKDKVLTLDWHWGENHIYPDQVAPAQKAGFRMTAGPDGTLLPEVRLPGQPWKSITGDIDLVSITNTNNSALTDEQYVQVLEKAGAGPIGVQHPATATWYNQVNDDTFVFDPINETFPDKAKYMQADKCCLMQVGPDGKARAVELKLTGSQFTSKNDYFLNYQGGYDAPAPTVLTPPTEGVEVSAGALAHDLVRDLARLYQRTKSEVRLTMDQLYWLPATRVDEKRVIVRA